MTTPLAGQPATPFPLSKPQASSTPTSVDSLSTPASSVAGAEGGVIKVSVRVPRQLPMAGPVYYALETTSVAFGR